MIAIKKLGIVSFICIILAVLGYIAIRYIDQLQQDKTTVNEIKQVRNTNETDTSQGKLADQYGSTYDEYITQVESSDPTKWDANMVNKAYFVLVYADKVGLFNDVFNVYESMREAATAGVDLDKNEYNMNQNTRDEILNRAKALQAAPDAEEAS